MYIHLCTCITKQTGVSIRTQLNGGNVKLAQDWSRHYNLTPSLVTTMAINQIEYHNCYYKLTSNCIGRLRGSDPATTGPAAGASGLQRDEGTAAAGRKGRRRGIQETTDGQVC